jgi:hypothetical protein
MGGYDFKAGNKLKIMPSALIKTDLKKAQTDVALNFTIIDKVLTGASVRGYSGKTIDALQFFLVLDLRVFKLFTRMMPACLTSPDLTPVLTR